MTICTRSKKITLFFSIIWLIMSFSFASWAECLCCNHNEPHKECCEKTHARECHLELNHVSQDCQYQCISCGKLGPYDLLRRKEYINTFGNDQFSVLKQIPFDSHIHVNQQDITFYQHNTFPLKYPSLFLINSSFLL